MLKDVVHFASLGIEAAAAVIVVLGATEATIRSLLVFARLGSEPAAVEAPRGVQDAVRLRLGRWLSLALEFELAADILRTGVAPGWNEIGQLAAIIVLRTALNYFLRKEIDGAAAR